MTKPAEPLDNTFRLTILDQYHEDQDISSAFRSMCGRTARPSMDKVDHDPLPHAELIRRVAKNST